MTMEQFSKALQAMQDKILLEKPEGTPVFQNRQYCLDHVNRGLVSLYAMWVDEKPIRMDSVRPHVFWFGIEGDTLWSIRKEMEVTLQQKCSGPTCIDPAGLRNEICAHMVALENAEPDAARHLYCTLVRCVYCLIAVTDLAHGEDA